ncbi:hypothetical protein E4T49_01692 [Aureobasidium sp. EXF-10728]|nr:hypothetical protein E4T49_01692 [Aureobasidium sp. EXF-10728]
MARTIPLDAALASVQGAAIDGRMKNIRTRQKQLAALFSVLTEHAGAFVDAVQKDDNIAIEEANIVVSATLLEIRQHYDHIDFKKELTQEYRVRWGKSCEERRIAASLVYIIPQSFTKSFGVFSALSAAIAAGCCCVVELCDSSAHVTGLIRQIIGSALDREAFVTTSSRAPESFLQQCLVVNQTSERLPLDSISKQLMSKPAGRVVAIVDRTANVESAAKEIFASRMQYGGKSRYAIDQVFVNEFVAVEFLAALQEQFSIHAEALDQNVKYAHAGVEQMETKFVQSEPVAEGCELLARKGKARAVLVNSRSHPLLYTNVDGPLLVVHKITSLDDVIDLLLSNAEILNSLYAFASGPEAKYLSQFIQTAVTFVNHIPAELLIGPPGPVGYPVRPELRYVREMFEEPSPQIVPGAKVHAASSVWKLRNTPRSAAILSQSSRPLKPMDQPPAGAWGFFETGVLLGAAVYLLPVIMGTIAGTTYASVWAYRRITDGRM